MSTTASPNNPVFDAPGKPGWRESIEATVTGLGYDMVDVERAPRGLLRIYIDRRPGQVYLGDSGEFVTVDDCEQVTRQLRYSLEVDGIDYERLEVSSPGLDRPLRREADFARFEGSEISLTLKAPMQGRKVFKGSLRAGAAAGQWELIFKDGKTEQVLGFVLNELREARLVPVVDFKGRRGAKGAAAANAEQPGDVGGLV